MQTGRRIPLAKSIAAVPFTVLGLGLLLAVSPAPALAETPLVLSTAVSTTAPELTHTYVSAPETTSPATTAIDPVLSQQPVNQSVTAATLPSPAASTAPPPIAVPTSTTVPAAASAADPSKNLIMPNGTGVNLRSGPGVDYELLIGVEPGDVLTALEEKDNWFKVEYHGMTGWVAGWVVTKCTGTLAGKTIVIDPGHGGEDPGAMGWRTGLKEKTVNLDIALRLGKQLKDLGARVVYTRDKDITVPLYDRPALANRLHADLFVSVHADSTSRSAINGTSTYYYQNSEPSRQGIFDRSITLAKDVQKSMISGSSISDRGVKQSPGRGFAVLRESQMPSILVETAFLSNNLDEAKLCSTDFRQSTAVSIARGLADYFKTQTDPTRVPGL